MGKIISKLFKGRDAPQNRTAALYPLMPDRMKVDRDGRGRLYNVFTDRLADVWVCEMERYREYDKFKKCTKCELKAWCRGCPAVAKGTNGDFYETDPQCWKEII